MFGDLFSQKTDLQLGLLYSSRRKFLVSAGKNSLEPPKDFKTKSQARRTVLNQTGFGDLLVEESHAPLIQQAQISPKRRESVAYGGNAALANGNPGSNLNSNGRLLGLLQPLKKSISEGSPKNSAPLRNFRKTAKFVMEAVIIDHFFEGNRDDWLEETKAGVHYYVNKITKEVTTECPWRPRYIVNKGTKMIIKQPSYKHMVGEEYEEEGTGSLVYDSTEVDELFSILNDLDKKNSSSSIHSPAIDSPVAARESPMRGTAATSFSSPMKNAALNSLLSPGAVGR